jgi:hypothetical protein
MHDSNYFSNLARRCRDLGKTAIEPAAIEQLRIWAAELAEIATLLHGSTAGRSQPPQRHLREANVLRPAKLEHPV